MLLYCLFISIDTILGIPYLLEYFEAKDLFARRKKKKQFKYFFCISGSGWGRFESLTLRGYEHIFNISWVMITCKNSLNPWELTFIYLFKFVGGEMCKRPLKRRIFIYLSPTLKSFYEIIKIKWFLTNIYIYIYLLRVEVCVHSTKPLKINKYPNRHLKHLTYGNYYA